MIDSLRALARSILRRASAPRTEFRPRTYWENRHQKLSDSLRSVGHICLNENQNYRDYDLKARQIVATLNECVQDPQDRSLLDAGCGIGVFSKAFAAAGFAITGVDFSPTALARARCSVQGEFLESDLAALDLARRFVVVACIDVLFDVTDDDVWEGILGRLTSHVKPTGLLLVQESLSELPARPAEHVRHRSLHMYLHRIEPELKLDQHRQYSLAAEQGHKDLLVFRAN